MAAARYVELNPVNAGIVKEAADYAWSNARFHLGLSQCDALVKDKSLLGLIDDWGDYLKGSNELITQTMLLRGTRTGRPAGSQKFVETIERLTGRDLGVRKAGRPLNRA